MLTACSFASPFFSTISSTVVTAGLGTLTSISIFCVEVTLPDEAVNSTVASPGLVAATQSKVTSWSPIFENRTVVRFSPLMVIFPVVFTLTSTEVIPSSSAKIEAGSANVSVTETTRGSVAYTMTGFFTVTVFSAVP